MKRHRSILIASTRTQMKPQKFSLHPDKPEIKPVEEPLHTAAAVETVNTPQVRSVKSKAVGGLMSAALIGVIVVGTAYAFQQVQRESALALQQAAAGRAPVVVQVQTEAAVGMDSFALPRRYVGLVVPERTVSLGFEVNGRVATVDVSVGEQVSQGDVLATLDQRRIEANLANANAALERAQAVLTLREAEVERAQSLRQSGIGTQQALDQARSNLQSVQADFDGAQAQIRTLTIDLDDTALRAPFDGQVTSVDFDLGDVVSPERSVLTLSAMARSEARIGVPVAVADQFRVGRFASILHRGDIIEAQIAAVIPRVNAASQTVDLVVALPAGTNAIDAERIALITDQQIPQKGFWVPLGALVSDLKGLFAVQIAADTGGDQPEIARAPVVVHFTDGERAFVSGALNDGDQVVTQGTNRVSPGQAVAIASAEAAD